MACRSRGARGGGGGVMSWEPEAEELRRRRELAQALGGAERVARHRAEGKLTVRERVERLVDKGSFQELGVLTGRATYGADGTLEAITPAPYVMGLARIDGRPVAVGGEDFTVRGATAPGNNPPRAGQAANY
jgi:acetyl-CoA carboxylase carboxyltransferase component